MPLSRNLSASSETGDPSSAPKTCYREVLSGLSNGITFELQSGRQRYTPLSFLVAVDFNGADEIIFRYTTGIVIVQGTGLGPIWELVQKNTLSCVSESTAAPSNGPWVKTIRIQAEEGETSLGPAFPTTQWK